MMKVCLNNVISSMKQLFNRKYSKVAKGFSKKKATNLPAKCISCTGFILFMRLTYNFCLIECTTY